MANCDVVLSQVWCLIVSIPDFCPLSYLLFEKTYLIALKDETKCLYFNFDWVVRKSVGSYLKRRDKLYPCKKGIVKYELKKCSLKHYFFVNYFIF